MCWILVTVICVRQLPYLQLQQRFECRKTQRAASGQWSLGVLWVVTVAACGTPSPSRGRTGPSRATRRGASSSSSRRTGPGWGGPRRSVITWPMRQTCRRWWTMLGMNVVYVYNILRKHLRPPSPCRKSLLGFSHYLLKHYDKFAFQQDVLFWYWDTCLPGYSLIEDPSGDNLFKHFFRVLCPATLDSEHQRHTRLTCLWWGRVWAAQQGGGGLQNLAEEHQELAEKVHKNRTQFRWRWV